MLLLAALLTLATLGCDKDLKKGDTEMSRDEIIEMTFASADKLNQNSSLGEYSLLDRPPFEVIVPSTHIMSNGEDSFDVYMYAGDAYITTMSLRSDKINVFGISIGENIAEADSVMLQEGYRQVSDGEVTNFMNKSTERAVAYGLYDITVTYLASPDRGVITRILIKVADPADQGVTY